MATTFAYALLERGNAWDKVFNSVNANFQSLDNFLSNNAEIVSYVEKFTANANQKAFVMRNSYIQGTNSLAVYKNGLRQWAGTDYTESTTNSFQFYNACNENDAVVAVITCMGSIDGRIQATVEPLIAMSGQQTFYLEKAYVPDTQSVLVYKNSDLLISGTDYTETSQRVITLTEPCQYKDIITVIANITLDTPVGSLTDMQGATEILDGISGLVPKPTAGNINQKFLRADGTWSSPPVFQGTDGSTVGVKGLVPRPAITDANKFLNSSGNWQYIQKLEKEAESNVTVISAGRDIALVKRATYTQNYSPLLSQKTEHGSWETTTDGEYLAFNYISDTNYQNAGNIVDYKLEVSPTEGKIKGLITDADYASQFKRPVNLTFLGDVSGSAQITGNQDVNLSLNVNKLNIPVNIGITGDVIGAVNFDGSTDVVINAVVPLGNETLAGKTKLYTNTGNNTDGTMTQAAITAALSSVYRFKGTVDNYYQLPTLNNTQGDAYQVLNDNLENNIRAGDTVSWNGTGWSKLAGITDVSQFLRLDGNYIESITVNENKMIVTPSIGETLNIQLGNDLNVPVASATTAGIIKIGSNLSVNGAGVLSANYALASYSTLSHNDGLMSWQDKQKLDSIDPNQIIREITSVNGIQFGNLSVDNQGVITLTKQNVIDALGYVPLSSDDIESMPENNMEDIISDIELPIDNSLINTDNSIKLYSSTGNNTDGTLTQSAITDIISSLQTRITELETERDTLTIELNDSYYKMSDIFVNYQEMTKINKRLNTTNLTVCTNMFKDCINLYDITPFNTANITNMQGMFENCQKLPAKFPFVIDCSSITSATSLENMFHNSSVTYVTLKDVNTVVKNNITADVLKGDISLIIEYR